MVQVDLQADSVDAYSGTSSRYQETSCETLSRALDYQFDNPQLLARALTHRSASTASNERLEFLGDGVLNFIIASELYQLYPDADEGQLSRLRSTLVKRQTLADIAAELRLGEYLLLGAGERRSGGCQRDSTLADALEAVLGAIYCDRGFQACQCCIRRLFIDRLKNLPDSEQLKDPKSLLQEHLQRRQFSLPRYRVLAKTGKSHEEQFLVECMVTELQLAVSARALGRRRAEHYAAQKMLDALKDTNISLSTPPSPVS